MTVDPQCTAGTGVDSLDGDGTMTGMNMDWILIAVAVLCVIGIMAQSTAID